LAKFGDNRPSDLRYLAAKERKKKCHEHNIRPARQSEWLFGLGYVVINCIAQKKLGRTADLQLD